MHPKALGCPGRVSTVQKFNTGASWEQYPSADPITLLNLILNRNYVPWWSRKINNFVAPIFQYRKEPARKLQIISGFALQGSRVTDVASDQTHVEFWENSYFWCSRQPPFRSNVYPDASMTNRGCECWWTWTYFVSLLTRYNFEPSVTAFHTLRHLRVAIAAHNPE